MRVLITGGSGGLGSAAAAAFGAHGATVHLWARDEDGLEQTAEAVEEAGGTASVRTVDIRDPEAVEEGVAAIDGSIDILLPCAAITAGPTGKTPLPDLTAEAFESVMQTNVTGVFTTIRAALPAMAIDGRVLVPSGSVAREPTPGIGAYGVSKAAVEGLARGFSADTDRIVGVVDPGLVATDLTGGKGRDPESVGELFVWAGTDCPAAELDGELVTLREWRMATR